MPFEGPAGGGGSRVQMGTKLYVNLYDLSPANQYLFPIGFGLHHSGIEINGREYSFASGAGIFEMSTPRQAPGAVWRSQIYMGSFSGGKDALNRALDVLRSEYGADDYHLFRRNCNHFSNALCYLLLGKSIPGHINRLADTAVCCCNCLIPQKMLEQAPVGDPQLSETSRFTTSRNTNLQSVFSGQGQTLGGDNNNSNKSRGSSFLATRLQLGGGGSRNTPAASSSTDDLTDRREKARQAAMARLERQKKASD